MSASLRLTLYGVALVVVFVAAYAVAAVVTGSA